MIETDYYVVDSSFGVSPTPGVTGGLDDELRGYGKLDSEFLVCQEVQLSPGPRMMMLQDLPSVNCDCAKGLVGLSKRAIFPRGQHQSVEWDAFPERTVPLTNIDGSPQKLETWMKVLRSAVTGRSVFSLPRKLVPRR